MEIIPSLILSVYTDLIADGLYRFLKSCNSVMMWIFFRWFYRRNDRGIQIEISVQWHGTVTGGLIDGYIDGTCPYDSIGKSQYILTLPTLSFSLSPSSSPSQLSPSKLQPTTHSIGFDVDYQWFLSLWNGFWLEHVWKTSMSILYGKQQGIHANKQG
jgi:hypothetical protein